MESREAVERFEKAEELATARESFGKRTAVLVAVLAAMLAIAGLGANRAQEEVLLAQVQASDTWNEYQANSLKKHINEDVAMTAIYKLYGRPGSGSLAVQVALEEIGAQYERIWVGREAPERPLPGCARRICMPKAKFNLNGKAVEVHYEPGMHLLEVLRERA